MTLPTLKFTDDGRKIYEPDGDVLCRFITDRSPVSIIRGPWGSGKTLAVINKIWAISCEQTPSPMDGLRKTRWGIVRNCYDDETEILTEDRGWVLFRDLIEGERVAQLRDGRLEFVAPSYYYKAPYVGEMLGFESEGVNFRVTPDHRMWVSKRRTRRKIWGDYEFAHARDIYGKEETVRVRRDAQWAGEDTGHSEAFCEWLGFWIAEGSSGVYKCADGFTRYQCVITQVKPDGIAYGRELFERAGLPFTQAKRPDAGVTLRLSVTPATRPIIVELAGLGHSTTKRVPAWLKRERPECIRAFLRGFIAGDGRIGAVTVGYTSSKRLCDELQELALRAGWVANVATYDATARRVMLGGVETGSTVPHHIVTFLTSGRHEPVLRRNPGRHRGWYRERYAGTVYCVEVPTHVVYVRRRGKAMWCSQTYSELRDTTLKDVVDWLPPSQYGELRLSKPMEYSMSMGDVRCELVFMALDTPEDVSKLYSTQFTGFWFHEMQFATKQVFDDAEGRTGRYPPIRDGGPKWSGVMGDMNEPGEDHWIPQMTGEVPYPTDMSSDERARMRWPKEWAYFVQPPALNEVFGVDGKTVTAYRVNPRAENLRWLPPKFYHDKVRGKTKQWVDSKLMNRISLYVEGRPVWGQFSPETHVAKMDIKPLPAYPILIGLDFGRSPAAVFGQFVNNRWVILDEIVAFGIGAVEFAPLVKRKLDQRFPGFGFRLHGDPKGQDKTQSDERTAYDIFESFGMRVNPAPVPQNNIQTRVDAVTFVLREMQDGMPRLLLDPTRPRTLKVAMAGKYHYEKIKGSGLIKEIPFKDQYSNIADALQYLVLGEGEGRAMVGRPIGKRAQPIQTRRAIRLRRRVA